MMALQALSSGLPVVAVAAGGLVDILKTIVGEAGAPLKTHGPRGIVCLGSCAILKFVGISDSGIAGSWNSPQCWNDNAHILLSAARQTHAELSANASATSAASLLARCKAVP